MKAADVRVADLKDYSECVDTIEKIKMNYHNTIGGFPAFNSGWQTHLTTAAVNKIAAIERKAKKFVDQMPDEDD